VSSCYRYEAELSPLNLCVDYARFGDALSLLETLSLTLLSNRKWGAGAQHACWVANRLHIKAAVVSWRYKL